MIDLEALAGHRGSLFGGLSAGAQPSQKLFESRLYAALADLDPSRPVVVEAESSRIGERVLPPRVWAGMAEARVVEVEAPLPTRVRRLVAGYADGDPQKVAAALDRLPRHIGRAEVARWRELLARGELEQLARELVERHYDPSYARARVGAPLLRVGTGDGSQEALRGAARAIAAGLSR